MPRKEYTDEEKRHLYQLVFGSPEGGEVLKDLYETFFHRTGIVAGNDPYVAVGTGWQRAMYMYIEDLVEGRANAGGKSVTTDPEPE